MKNDGWRRGKCDDKRLANEKKKIATDSQIMFLSVHQWLF
jgi:hypothetical protein